MSQSLRTADVLGARTVEQIDAYLPRNYRVVGSYTNEDDRFVVQIEGVDNAGWTLEDYVIPRLASGLYFVTDTGVKQVEAVTVKYQGLEVTVDANQDLADVIDDILNDLFEQFPNERYERLAEIADEMGQLAINQEV